jgi:hypothetical protein
LKNLGLCRFFQVSTKKIRKLYTLLLNKESLIKTFPLFLRYPLLSIDQTLIYFFVKKQTIHETTHKRYNHSIFFFEYGHLCSTHFGNN